MKIFTSSILVITILLGFSECSKLPTEVLPDACMVVTDSAGVETSTFKVNQLVIFSICGSKQPYYASVWPGDSVFDGTTFKSSQNYASYGTTTPGNGFNIESGSFTYITATTKGYQKPGTYTATMVFGSAPNNGEEIKKSTVSKTITVIP